MRDIKTYAQTFCKWAVAYKIDGDNYDDGQEREGVTAVFCYPFQAEDFINNCLPAESRHRFYIKHID